MWLNSAWALPALLIVHVEGSLLPSVSPPSTVSSLSSLLLCHIYDVKLINKLCTKYCNTAIAACLPTFDIAVCLPWRRHVYISVVLELHYANQCAFLQWHYSRRTCLQPHTHCPSSTHCQVVSCFGRASLVTVDQLHAGQDGAGFGIKAGGGGSHEALPVQGKHPPQVHHRAQVALNTISYKPVSFLQLHGFVVSFLWHQAGDNTAMSFYSKELIFCLQKHRTGSAAFVIIILLQQQHHS